MVFVLFYTPNKEIILQRRSLLKKSSPGKLTTTVSGHVESGFSYVQSAVKETYEETGVKVAAESLHSLGVLYAGFTSGTYASNAMRGMYLLEYTGDIADLKIEVGEAEGFEVISTDEYWRRRNEAPEDLSLFLVGDLGETMVRAIENI